MGIAGRLAHNHVFKAADTCYLPGQALAFLPAYAAVLQCLAHLLVCPRRFVFHTIRDVRLRAAGGWTPLHLRLDRRFHRHPGLFRLRSTGRTVRPRRGHLRRIYYELLQGHSFLESGPFAYRLRACRSG